MHGVQEPLLICTMKGHPVQFGEIKKHGRRLCHLHQFVPNSTVFLEGIIKQLFNNDNADQLFSQNVDFNLLALEDEFQRIIFFAKEIAPTSWFPASFI
jgi:hypothetical protein